MTTFHYKVFSASRTESAAEATLPSGKTVTAMEPVLMVQLLPTDHPDAGTVKLIISDDLEQAESVFVEGAEIVATFKPKE